MEWNGSRMSGMGCRMGRMMFNEWGGVGWGGVVWCGVVWCGLAWRGVAWCRIGRMMLNE